MEREIIRADTMGFCMGVRRAIEKAENLLEEYSGGYSQGPIYSLGPLIHNRSALERFSKRGMVQADGIEEIAGGTVIIRAHGIPPGLRERLEKKNVHLVDATCTRVLGSQKTADTYSRLGYHILLVGDKNHGEIKAIAGCASEYTIIGSEEEARIVDLPERTLVIGQTTLTKRRYDEICGILEHRFPTVEIVQSICPATERRQNALQELAEKVDAVLVVGGRNSANTRGLLDTALKTGRPAWLIENGGELPGEIVSYRRIGITAGASTPDWVIEEVENVIRKLP